MAGRRLALVALLGCGCLLAVTLAGCSTPAAARLGTSPTASSSAATTSTTTGSPASSRRPLARFLRLATKGAEGTFFASYRIVARGSPFGVGTGIVAVAQRAAAGRDPFLNIGQRSVGEWSYNLAFSHGWHYHYQWIENGGMAQDCWGPSTRLTCYGPSRFEPSNGFAISITPYVPGVLLQMLQQVASGGPGNGPRHTTIFEEAGNSTTGKLTCLRDRTSQGTDTWCLTTSGFFASFKGSGNIGPLGFSSVFLLSKATTAPTSAFRPAGHLASGFGLPPAG
ncbi:MAG: hypothetical protein ACYDGN_13940 [Acidimicrobiales bacterium]